jgi:hypothetical protein
MERRSSEAVWTRILERDSALIYADDMRHLLTCDHDGGVTIIRRACRMLSEGIVDDYLSPIRDSRWGVRTLGVWECEATNFETLVYPKTTQAILSKEKERSERSYTSEEAKSTKERCIRVAAIVIMITPGASNICGVEKNEKSRISPHRLQ